MPVVFWSLLLSDVDEHTHTLRHTDAHAHTGSLINVSPPPLPPPLSSSIFPYFRLSVTFTLSSSVSIRWPICQTIIHLWSAQSRFPCMPVPTTSLARLPLNEWLCHFYHDVTAAGSGREVWQSKEPFHEEHLFQPLFGGDEKSQSQQRGTQLLYGWKRQ